MVLAKTGFLFRTMPSRVLIFKTKFRGKTPALLTLKILTRISRALGKLFLFKFLLAAFFILFTIRRHAYQPQIRNGSRPPENSQCFSDYVFVFRRRVFLEIGVAFGRQIVFS